jgi:hypothetical protein
MSIVTFTTTTPGSGPRPTSPVDDLRCRLDAAGWLAGGTPSVEDQVARLDRLFTPGEGEGASSTDQAPATVPLWDARTRCAGLLRVRQNRFEFILEAGTEATVRGATEDLLTIVGATPVTSLTQWTENGEQRSTGRVRGAPWARTVLSGAMHGAPLVLWVITLALALVSVAIAAAVGENSTQGWLADWAHATLDRVFTGALGAALVSTVMAAQQPSRSSPGRGRRTLVSWRNTPHP